VDIMADTIIYGGEKKYRSREGKQPYQNKGCRT
jgi:hypothetical protein